MKGAFLPIALTLFALSFNSCSKKLPEGAVKEEFIHKYGVSMAKNDWESRGRNGQVVTTMKNGVTISRSFSNGQLDGETTHTFPYSNAIATKETFDKGKLTSFTKHFPSGVPMWQKEILPDGKSLLTNWYEDGTPQSVENFEEERLTKGEYFTFKHELESKVTQKEGTRIRRDAYGNLLSKDLIKEGEMVLRTTFHPNGDPKAITQYANGLPHGLKKTFWIGGSPNSVEEWANGVQSGLTTLYQNGEKRAEIPFIEGMKNGIERRFQNGNIVVAEVEWKNNRKHGATHAYFGDKSDTTWYFEDKVVTKLSYQQLNAR